MSQTTPVAAGEEVLHPSDARISESPAQFLRVEVVAGGRRAVGEQHAPGGEMSSRESFEFPHARAMALNPSAGTHPVTSDSREISAAGRAGDRSFREFPYYEERYGDRGRLFALSDGAWIVTLCSNPDTAAITAEVEWLAEVLSSRGMPSILMERHLEFIEEELSSAVPEKAGEYARLGVARRALVGRRQARLSDPELHRLSAEFERAADPAVLAKLPRMGLLLGSAAADEANGMARAVASVLEWVADRTRFSADWITAVEATSDAARRTVRSTGGDGSSRA